MPLSSLFLSPVNVRRVAPGSIENMAASLQAVGQIQNLVVVRTEEDPEKLGVIVGGRRFRGMEMLRDRGDWAVDAPVKVEVRDASEATIVSLTENVEREDMHPADEYEAFGKLKGQGYSIDKIADAFGVTPLVVERRLSLAAAAPELMALYREGKINTDQLIALCATTDHARQIEVWNTAPNSHANYLRKLITTGEVDSTNDRRVAFIGGVKAYEAAGGEVRRDLFSKDGEGGFLQDALLLERLVAEKLEASAEEVRGEGWSWVEAWTEFDYQAFNRFGQIDGTFEPLTGEAGEKLATLEAEAEALEAEEQALQSGDEELTDEQSDRLDAIWDRQRDLEHELDAINARRTVIYTEDQKSVAGAIVAMNNGELRIERGQVRTADRKAAAAACGEIAGGRETNPTGRKEGISDALRRSLLGRRNHAAQMQLAKAVKVSKVLQAIRAIEIINHTFDVDRSPCDLVLRDGGDGTRTNHAIVGDDAEHLGREMREHLASLTGKLPRSQNELFDQLSGKTDEELDAINACGVAYSLSLQAGHKGLTGKVLDAIGFNVADHVNMTADAYFGRVTKPVMLESLKEAGLDDGRDQLHKMKKGDLAAEAERRVREDGFKWVPKLIRSPAPKAQKSANQTAAKPNTRKTKR